MRGAGDTVRSIIISANSRLAFLENKQVLRLLSKDELNLSDIGIGVNGDGETKTALCLCKKNVFYKSIFSEVKIYDRF